MMKKKTLKFWLPRKRVPFNTGTRPHADKKAYRRVKRVEVAYE